MTPKRQKSPTGEKAASRKPQPSLEVFDHDDAITKALAIVAHPDDVDFGMAGTIATLTSQGVAVTYCLVTSGDAGGDDMVMAKEERAKIREDEQRAAAACVGVRDLVFLGYPDGLVEPTLALRRDLARVIRTVRPDVVLTQSPERNYERIYASHPDHLATGEAALRAVYPDARNPHAFPALLNDEGLAPHTVTKVWMGGTNPTMVVDTTSTIDKKIEALKCHKSQVGDGERLDAMLREWGGMIAKNAGLPKGRLAEAFRVIATA
ncbi:MAG TPA: PIG-L deacetylase family protein [Acidimicrobiales bacterium]|nr:PIG-L deacetylase family protein [Acidimicrobiales bacterium]